MKKIIIFGTILLIFPALAKAASVSLSPAFQNLKAGDIFIVSVNLDTQGSNIEGVDLRYVNYNPALLEV